MEVGIAEGFDSDCFLFFFQRGGGGGCLPFD